MPTLSTVDYDLAVWKRSTSKDKFVALISTRHPQKALRDVELPLYNVKKSSASSSITCMGFDKARLIASSALESGLWLDALPVAFVGTLRDDHASKIVSDYVMAKICLT